MTDDASVEQEALDPLPRDGEGAPPDSADLEPVEPVEKVIAALSRDDEEESAAFEPAAMRANSPASTSPAVGSLSLLHEVDMEVTVELGRTTMPIRELLALQPGMVVEIERDAGAPIDVLVNGRLIACGEVVVIDEEFGIRITEIAAPGNVH